MRSPLLHVLLQARSILCLEAPYRSLYCDRDPERVQVELWQRSARSPERVCHPRRCTFVEQGESLSNC